MALSPATQRVLREAGSWGVVAVICAAALSHFSEITSGAGQLLGTPSQKQAVANVRDDEEQVDAAVKLGSLVELKAGRNGHFNTEAEINGRGIPVMIDTGATMVALSYEDAERAGIFLSKSDYTQAVSTANGVARIAPVTLDRVTIGDITVRNVPAAVAEPGRLQTSLLGMSFLGRLSRFDMRSGKLVLQE
jgi:aspartyl protease family protein